MNDQARRSRWSDVAIIASIVIVSIGLRPPRDVFLDNDEGVYAVVAMMILDGKTQYQDVYDNKPPLVHLLYAATFAAFGRSLTALHAVLIAFVLLTQLFIYKIVKRLTDRYAGYAAALCYGIFSTTFRANDVLAANCELFMVLPAAVSIYWVLKAYQENKVWGFFLVGFFGAVGGLFKQVAILDTAGGCLFVAIPVFTYYVRRAVSRPGNDDAGGAEGPLPQETLKWLALAAALVVAGIACAVGLVLLYFWHTGALSRLLYEVGFNVGYVEAISPANMLLAFRYKTRLLLTDNWLLFALAVAGALAIVVPGPRDEKGAGAPRMTRLLLLCWAFFSLLGVSIGRRFFYHYYLQSYPPLAALAGVAIRSLTSDWRGGGWRRARNLATASLLLFGTLLPMTRYHGFGRTLLKTWRDLRADHWDENATERNVGRWIEQNTEEHDKVFIWGFAPSIYWYADRQPSSGWIVCNALAGMMPAGSLLDAKTPRHDTTRNWRIWREDLEKCRPEIIVDATAPGVGYSFGSFPIRDFEPLRELIEREYVKEEETIPCVKSKRVLAHQELGEVVLYRRRNPVGGGTP